MTGWNEGAHSGRGLDDPWHTIWIASWNECHCVACSMPQTNIRKHGRRLGFIRFRVQGLGVRVEGSGCRPCICELFPYNLPLICTSPNFPCLRKPNMVLGDVLGLHTAITTGLRVSVGG